MGSAKAELDWHGSTLVRRVTGILRRTVDGPVVLVAAPGQSLPALGSAVEVVVDRQPGRGPLQGLADGLAAAGGRSPVAYVSSVDVPLLHPEFVRRVLACLADDVDVAVPEVEGRVHPLAGAYRVSVRDAVRAQLSEGRLALGALLERCRVRRLAATELPALDSLTNLNSREDYGRALALPAPCVRVDGAAVGAWTLGEAAPGGGPVTLNGEPVEFDPELPLVAGDVIQPRA
jgi:molybdopterin-guanine dinucleotide biosynthesis protein A